METAPKDGRDVLVALSTGVDIANWQEEKPDGTECGVVVDPGLPEGWYGYLGLCPWDKEQPTHWMPLPDPPSTEASLPAARPSGGIPQDAESSLAWIRRKLSLPDDAQMFTGQETIAGRLHVLCHQARGYIAYIEACKCNDKQGEIARLTVRAETAEAELAKLEASASSASLRDEQKG